jgi:hypothetical protein
MAQAVSRRLLTVNARIRSQVSPCAICDKHSDTVNRFLTQYFSIPLSLSFHKCSILVFLYTLLLPEGQTGEAWEPAKKQSCF